MAKLARGYAGPEREVRAATVNGAAGAVIFVAGQPTAIMGFVVRDGRSRRDRRAGRPGTRRADRPARGDRLAGRRRRLQQRDRGVVLQHPVATLVDEHELLGDRPGELRTRDRYVGGWPRSDRPARCSSR